MDELSRWYENLNYQEAKDILREKLDNMKKNFIAAGYYMKYIRDNELFREDGYESIWEFAEGNYGIRKSTASRWMAMNDKFSRGGNSPVLAEEFRDFEKSQLQEMLYLDDKQIEEVTPDMTVKEIREVRKPAEPVIVLKKPDEKDREYLDAAAKHLINCLYDWFLQDHMNRVLLVDRSPEEIKKKLGKDHRWRCFSTATGTAQINLFDDYVQLWDEKSECIGDFDWFYLAASIQSMWNEVALEKIKEEPKLRNAGQRKEFLENHRQWPVWFRVNEASEVYYRYDLPDGSSIVICEYHMWLSWKEKYSDENPDSIGIREYLLRPGYHYLEDCKTNMTALVEHLKKFRRRENKCLQE